MPNQTPHTQSPLSPSLLGRGLGGGLSQKMKPIIIPPEMQDLVKKINELATTVIPELEKSEEENRIRELEKQQNQLPDYTEVAGLKVLTQDLDKPQCPEVKLLKEGQPYQECCCYELEHDWEVYYQYDWHGAMKEAEFRGLELLNNKDWDKLEKKLGARGLKHLFGLMEVIDFKGYYIGIISEFRDKEWACYWSGPSSSSNFSWTCNLCYYTDAVKCCTDDNYKILSVRCRLKD